MTVRTLLTNAALAGILMLCYYPLAQAQDEPVAEPAETPVQTQPEEPKEVKPDPVADFIWVDTIPSGAKVSLGGKDMGTTPSMIQRLDDGDHELTFTLKGYEPQKESIKVPNDGKQSQIELQQKNGSCLIQSNPSNATVVLGPRLLGRTPIILNADEIAPGEYLARVMKAGYVSKKVSITIEAGQPTKQVVELENDLGEMKITTAPAGAHLYIDGFDMGPGQKADDASRKSKPRTFSGIVSGKHKVHLVYGGEPGLTMSVRVQADKSVKVDVLIWYPDSEIRTVTDKTLHAMVIKTLANGDLVVATSPTKAFTLKKADIKHRSAIPLAEGKRLVLKERIRRKMREQEERARKLR